MSSEKKSKPGSASFEEDLSKLEEIVTALEAGKLPLDEALRQFEAGVGLVRKCEKTLNDAERKIEMLVRGMDGNLVAEPFDEETAEEETTTVTAPVKKSAVRKAALSSDAVEDVAESDTDEEDDGDELF